MAYNILLISIGAILGALARFSITSLSSRLKEDFCGAPDQDKPRHKQ